MKTYAEEGELKPCPFCGGESELKPYRSRGFEINCTKCHVRMRQMVVRRSLEWLREGMVKDWNSRVSETEIATLKELLNKSGHALIDALNKQ